MYCSSLQIYIDLDLDLDLDMSRLENFVLPTWLLIIIGLPNGM